ncbi:MAG: RNA-binding protein [Micropepsaceae bacterium]
MARQASHSAKTKTEDEGAEGPLRRCIASGEVKAPEAMIRFVIGPDQSVVPDIAQKLPGRGYWLTADKAVILKALERDAFSKAAKAKVSASPDLAQLVESLLVRRCGELLGLAKRAGGITLGFVKVENVLRRQAGRIAALVEASDSGGADRGKLVSYVRRNGGIRVIGCLTDAEIGLALGRENVVHAALTQSPLADRFIVEAERLGGFRVLCPPDWGAA